MNRILRFLPPLFLTVILLWVYGSTIAPGLTWAHNGADGGDLIAATATGGVPHPTGYPLYLLLAGFFQRLPIGPLAFRTNLLSALAMTGAALWTYFLVRRSLAQTGNTISAMAGMASAFVFALSPLVWSQAIITEVYALHLFFIAGLLFLLSLPETTVPHHDRDILTGLMMGLALANHITSVFLLPLFVIGTRGTSSFFRRIGCMALGLSVYLIIPLRAATFPPVNWGNASSLHGFLWLVTGRLYQDELLTLGHIWTRAQNSALILLSQFGILGVVIGLLGLTRFFLRSPLRWNILWVVCSFFLFSAAYATRDSQVYLLPIILGLAIGAGHTLGGLAERWPKWKYPIAAVFAIVIALLAVKTWPQVDLSHDTEAERFGVSTLAQVPPDAIIFARTDEAVFALWYFHYALGERPDVVIVAVDLLHHDWYLQTLRATYPALVVPGPLPFGETVRQANPDRVVCYVEAPQRPSIECVGPTP